MRVLGGVFHGQHGTVGRGGGVGCTRTGTKSQLSFSTAGSYLPLLPTLTHPCWSIALASFSRLHNFWENCFGEGYWTIWLNLYFQSEQDFCESKLISFQIKFTKEIPKSPLQTRRNGHKIIPIVKFFCTFSALLWCLQVIVLICNKSNTLMMMTIA